MRGLKSGFSVYNTKVLAVAFLVALLTLLVYLPALQNGFVNWDDPQYVYENPHIGSIDSEFFKWMFTTFHASNWHPLTWLSHAIDYAIWGLNPFGHHLTSIILHGLNTFLVVIIITRLINYANPPLPPFTKGNPSYPTFSKGGRGGITKEEEYNTSIIAGAVTGLLFGIHPLHVESVAWVSERKDVLYAFFYLLSIVSYLKYTSSQRQEFSRHPSLVTRHWWYSLCLIFFILSLMSKPMAVTLPIVLLFLDFYPLGRLSFKSAFTNPPLPPFTKGGLGGIKVLLEKLPFLVLSLASSVITIIAQQRAIVSFEVHPFGERFLIAFQALGFYLLKMLWPTGLSPLYPYSSKISFLTIEYMSALMLSVCITAFCILSWKRQKVFPVIWAYYIVTLLPVLGIIQVGDQAAANRYTYLPSLGPFTLVGLGTIWLIEKIISRKHSLTFRKLSLIILMSIILVLLSNLTIIQTRIWKDSITLWNCVLKIFPNDAWIAYYNRGKAFEYLGNYQKATEDFKKTIELNPNYAKAYYNQGVIYDCHFSNYQQAIKNYSKAIELNPKYTIAYNNRGAVYATLGDYHRAIEDFDIAINLDNQDSGAYYNRGLSYKMLDKHNQAVKDFQASAQLGNKQAQYYLKLKGIGW